MAGIIPNPRDRSQENHMMSTRRRKGMLRPRGLVALALAAAMLTVTVPTTQVLADSTKGVAKANDSGKASEGRAHGGIGGVKIRTLPVPEGVNPRSAAFTQSGKLVLRYSDEGGGGKLATIGVDGSEFRPFFEGGAGDGDNLLFEDGKRIHQGETIVECTEPFEECDDAKVVPIAYPAPLNRDNPRVLNPAQEAIIAPDNKTQSWMVLLNDFTVAILTGTLERKTDPDRYELNDSRIISTVEPYEPDPANPDGVIPVQPIINGEVKQFVHGGEGISVVGGKELVTADSTVIRLDTAEVDQITYTPGYDETAIFSPDERLGMVMTTRFSEVTDLGILGVMPRPHPISLNMGLARYMYTHGVTGVRGERPGNIGPALIDIERSKTEPGYTGINLATDDDWVYRSPMEWSPDSKMGVWPELSQSGEGTRIRIVELPAYKCAGSDGGNAGHARLDDRSREGV